MAQESEEDCTCGAGLPFWKLVPILQLWFKDVTRTSPHMHILEVCGRG